MCKSIKTRKSKICTKSILSSIYIEESNKLHILVKYIYIYKKLVNFFAKTVFKQKCLFYLGVEDGQTVRMQITKQKELYVTFKVSLFLP